MQGILGIVYQGSHFCALGCAQLFSLLGNLLASRDRAHSPSNPASHREAQSQPVPKPEEDGLLQVQLMQTNVKARESEPEAGTFLRFLFSCKLCQGRSASSDDRATTACLPPTSIKDLTRPNLNLPKFEPDLTTLPTGQFADPSTDRSASCLPSSPGFR